MLSSRLEVLKNMVEQNPADSFARYGLAMEYRKANAFDQAIAEFRALAAANPDYAAAYFHGGQTLEQMGRIEEARELYRAGIAAATRTGDRHTRDEIQAALDILG
jgi:tetratricopeptide (TPR) repeat protein